MVSRLWLLRGEEPWMLSGRWAGGVARRHTVLGQHAWRGMASIVVLMLALLSLGAMPALASDIEWSVDYQNTAFPFRSPQYIAADASGLYVLGYLEESRASTTTIIQKYDPAGSLLWEKPIDDIEGATNVASGLGIAASGDAVYVA